MKVIIYLVLVILLAVVNTVYPAEVYKKGELYAFDLQHEYTGKDLMTIAFPVGGLATGNITLGGRGDIRELEIFNRPAKGESPDMTFFSIWVREEGKSAVARILERRLIPPYVGWMGFPRNQLAGVPRFEEAVFRGEYPFAYLTLMDETVPVDVHLEAFNPYIPLYPDESGIPGAVFNWRIANPTDSRISVSVAFSMQNPIKTKDKDENLNYGGNVNQYIDDGTFRGIKMATSRAGRDDLEYGNIAFVTTEQNVDVQTRWYRGGWWDNAHMFWDDFSDDGHIQRVTDTEESEDRRSDAATLLVSFDLEPGQEKVIPYYLTWYFPNRENYWNREEEVKGKRFKNYYATQFNDAWDAAGYLIKNIAYLTQKTRRFHDLIFNSTYPWYVIDAVSANMSALKTNVVIRDEMGRFYGWEGLTDDAGCCMGTCTHVWNYEQTLASLFPSMERSMREIAFLNDTFDNGYQTFRTLFPPGPYWWKVHPATDGQMGNIIRVYREWKYSGDTDWLRKMWPKVRAALEFAWKGIGDGDSIPEWQKEGMRRPWDPNQDGVMEGQQHNTYDIDFYGPNTMVGSLYLGALKAASEMASAMGEKKKAKEYLQLFRKGSKKYDTLLWNGEYYIQKVDVMDGLEIPERLVSPEKECDDPECQCKASPGGKKNALEKGSPMPKYQYGEGCLSDQLLGQYLSFVTGLGYVLESGHVNQAMLSIFKYNFRNGLSRFANVQRVYALNDEDGLLLCSWPRGNRPALPFVYSDEVWTGIEYQVAASLIYSGHIDEGLTIVNAVRDRHRGFNRNPWDEFECGHHYARALASWAVLLALSGFQYDGVTHTMAFSPQVQRDDFQTFWSTGSGWGEFRIKNKEIHLKVDHGNLKINRFGISKDCGFKQVTSVLLNSENMRAKSIKDDAFVSADFTVTLEMGTGDILTIRFDE